ncbi:hydrogen peroxide-inducible genes activator [Pontivivens insulae]|uniref:Hydrogen peroxide-inducible genes activator n=1 Tax=Pontivivens insulae TaxID=1639689 RepID=A0A2R8A7T6_9RHOB|nr:hydrogen peroxide-inducible genes activator [Pontivivens insulae]RED18393.1 LysR family transcriptional regulator [Pontivivens insulae]SPF28291.1 Hydrogen peroxide-inducible genes activator [Pontivivens insulae]
MANLTLKQLRYFEAVARHRHFGHAAESCAISQPALSVQIKELEASLGTRLIERGPRQIALTAFGEDLAGRAREILNAVDALPDLARAAQNQRLGKLRLGVIPTIAPYLLPTLCRNLMADAPGLDLHIRETLTPKLLEELADGRLDAAIVALPVSEPQFTEVALFDEDFVLVRSVEEADQPVPDGETLRRMRLLLLEEGHCFRDQALAFCSVPAAIPRDGLDGSSLTTLVQMVGAGIGVTLIPEMAIKVETQSAPVAVSPFDAPKPSRTVGMIWRKTNPLAQQLLHVSEVVDRAAAELGLKGSE